MEISLFLLCNFWACLALSFVPASDLGCVLPFERPDYNTLIV